MRIAIVTLTSLVVGCAPTGSIPPPSEGGDLVVSVRVVRQPSVEPDADRPDVDAGAGLASSIDPLPGEGLDTADGRSHMGDLYARAGLIPEAILEYRHSIDLDPSNAVRHFKLGLAYQSLRQFEDALASYQEAARLEPDSAWAHAAVSIVHAKMGHQEQAFEAYRTVKDLDGDMAQGLLEVIVQYGSFHEV